jgi:hypothetical protein
MTDPKNKREKMIKRIINRSDQLRTSRKKKSTVEQYGEKRRDEVMKKEEKFFGGRWGLILERGRMNASPLFTDW